MMLNTITLLVHSPSTMATAGKGEVVVMYLLDLVHVTDKIVAKKLPPNLANWVLRFAISESKELPPPIHTSKPLDPYLIPHIFLKRYKHFGTHRLILSSKILKGLSILAKCFVCSINTALFYILKELTSKHHSCPWQTGFRLYHSPQDPR